MEDGFGALADLEIGDWLARSHSLRSTHAIALFRQAGFVTLQN
jgi:hypothetical protein